MDRDLRHQNARSSIQCFEGYSHWKVARKRVQSGLRGLDITLARSLLTARQLDS